MVLSEILVYPIKSLDGVSVKETRITAGGILEFDRIYAIVDDAGAYVNGKRTARVHSIRTHFDPDFQSVCAWRAGDLSRCHFSLTEPSLFNTWLSDHFGFTVRLVSEKTTGFPDDTTAAGPTLTSVASLEQVTSWFPEMNLESARRRFRSNLEISEVAPFWEDHLFGAAGERKPFQIGDVNFLGHNPCQRCVVPTRDPEKNSSIPNFQKSFMELRRKNLPPWANADRFNHFYRFAVNTSIPASETGKVFRVGDKIVIG